MKDGGQAFPVPAGHIDANGNAFYPEYGMTLRGYFAGQALVGLLASTAHPESSGPDEHTRDQWARMAHRLADAMLKEREK
jgi:hypothetical protein